MYQYISSVFSRVWTMLYLWWGDPHCNPPRHPPHHSSVPIPPPFFLWVLINVWWRLPHYSSIYLSPWLLSGQKMLLLIPPEHKHSYPAQTLIFTHGSYPCFSTFSYLLLILWWIWYNSKEDLPNATVSHSDTLFDKWDTYYFRFLKLSHVQIGSYLAVKFIFSTLAPVNK